MAPQHPLPDDLDDVERKLRQVLSRPPAVVGAQLRLEQDLADRMKVSRNRIRQALASMTRDGLLARRRGSGTYLRRMPQPVAARLAAEAGPDADLRVEDVLIRRSPAPNGSPHAHRSAMVASRLSLSLWSNLDTAGACAQLILKGMACRAEELGCRLNLRTILARDDQRLPRDMLADRLQHDESDGHMVLDAWARPFLDATVGSDRPVVFFEAGTLPMERDSIVFIDTHGAMVQAMLMFKETGFRRIGVLAEAFSDTCEHRMERAFRYALRGLDLPGGWWSCHRHDQAVDVSTTAQALRTAVTAAHGLDALYVASDVLMPMVNMVLSEMGRVPGVDLGVIVLSNRGLTLPAAPQDQTWSRMESDPQMFGHMVVNKLVDKIQFGSHGFDAISAHCRWLPGTTHRGRVAGAAKRSGG